MERKIKKLGETSWLTLDKKNMISLEPKIGKKGKEEERLMIIIKNFCFHDKENLEEIDRIINEDTEGMNYKRELLEYLIYEGFPRVLCVLDCWVGDKDEKRDTLANYIFFDLKKLINKYFEKEEKERLFNEANKLSHEFDQLI